MMPIDPTAGHVDHLIRVLAGLDAVAPTIEALAVASGLDLVDFNDALAAADVAGLVTPWEEAPDGPAVALSPLAVERMGLRLVEDSDAIGHMSYRWVGREEPESKSERLCRPAHRHIQTSTIEAETADSGWSYWDTVIDENSADPAERIERSEAAEDFINAPRPDDPKAAKVPPRPINALAIKVMPIGLRPQNNGPVEPAGPCRGCSGRPLELHEVCVICLRAGLDPYLEPVVIKKSRREYGTSGKSAGRPAKRSARKKALKGGKGDKRARASA